MENIGIEIGIREILYVIKMLSKENGWCHRVEFFYDAQQPEKSVLTFYIGPIKYKAALSRNGNSRMFTIPAESMAGLPLQSSFVIFIDDRRSGQCVMLTKKKIVEYMASRPAPISGFTMIDDDYLYSQRFWTSEVPQDDDLMLIYPEMFQKAKQ